MINTQLRKEQLKKEYSNRIKNLDYWDKVYKMFEKKKKKNIKVFTYSFKHDIFSPVQPDNESKISAYARANSYAIIDEKLSSTKSTYTFQLIEEK